ncbi:Ppx/GppA family phosphatase [Acuticoccus yangtzensis]|uniref:Ppx/GppA family phosphatase n=1 Tax=Acuticoccus yangtzensis TaxID=1443441 RepID=UPI0009FAEFE6|nr:Ppx/GppA phosphatase family protein [Acuticoccus yangtzensis]
MVDLTRAREFARGRRLGDGIAVIDVGSNSVRLVIYERASRAPTVVFNEKVLAALGEGLVDNGRLTDESMGRALMAIRRFAAMVKAAEVEDVTIVATAAARVASNGAAFIRDIEQISGVKVRVLEGAEEAHMAAAGVLCGFWQPDGVVGDLGGGSLELIDITKDGIGPGESHPLGTLRLRGDAKGQLAKGGAIARDILARSEPLLALKGRTFYAVGGTWRSLVKLHMAVTGYPIPIMHQYAVSADEMADFCDELIKNGLDTMDPGNVVSKGRRPLVPWGAVVMRALIALGQPKTILTSSLGVREGMIYEALAADERGRDPLIVAAEELAILRNRSPLHSAELVDFSQMCIDAMGLEESEEDQRLRIAACLLSDISWRSHPDYRADQALAVISNVALYGVDHPGRGFLAQVLNERYGGPENPAVAHNSAEALCSDRLRERAKAVAAILRIAYVLAPGISGVIPKLAVERDGGSLILRMPADMAAFDGERPLRRMRQLAKVVGLEGQIRAG